MPLRSADPDVLAAIERLIAVTETVPAADWLFDNIQLPNTGELQIKPLGGNLVRGIWITPEKEVFFATSPGIAAASRGIRLTKKVTHFFPVRELNAVYLAGKKVKVSWSAA